MNQSYIIKTVIIEGNFHILGSENINNDDAVGKFWRLIVLVAGNELTFESYPFLVFSTIGKYLISLRLSALPLASNYSLIHVLYSLNINYF